MHVEHPRSNGRQPEKPLAGKVLTRKTLRGVWPALIVPWNLEERVDKGRLREEIELTANEGVHGTYTGGTTGEFYGQDDAAFADLTEHACRHAHEAGLAIQIGCTALSTRCVQERVRIAIACGCDAIQLALPFWIPLDDHEVLSFFEDVVATAAATPIVFYQTTRAKRRIDAPLIGELCRTFPSLIGIKDTGCNHQTLMDILEDAPDIAVFGTDVDLLERMRLGTHGTYSSVAGLNASLVLAIYNYCVQGQFELAETLQDAVRRLMYEVLHPMGRAEGLWDSALDRIQRVVGGGNVGLRCQRPYRSATPLHVEIVRDWCRREAPVLLEQHLIGV